MYKFLSVDHYGLLVLFFLLGCVSCGANEGGREVFGYKPKLDFEDKKREGEKQ